MNVLTVGVEEKRRIRLYSLSLDARLQLKIYCRLHTHQKLLAALDRNYLKARPESQPNGVKLSWLSQVYFPLFKQKRSYTNRPKATLVKNFCPEFYGSK